MMPSNANSPNPISDKEKQQILTFKKLKQQMFDTSVSEVTDSINQIVKIVGK